MTGFPIVWFRAPFLLGLRYSYGWGLMELKVAWQH